MTDATNRGGRPALPEAKVLKVGSIRLMRAHWAKFYRLGGVAWLRRLIEKAREPDEA